MLDARCPVTIFANGIGDHLLSLPAVRALAGLFHDRLTLICMEGASQTFFSDIPARMVCESEMLVVPAGWEFDAGAVAEKVGECDFFISLNPWHSASVNRLLKLLSPTFSLGFFPEFKIALPCDFTKHSADLAFDIPQYLDRTLRLEDYAQPPVFARPYRKRTRELLKNIPAEMSVLAVHTETKPDKSWPGPSFVSLFDMFVDRHPEFMVLVVDEQYSCLDTGRRRDHVVPCNYLDLPVALSLVGESDVFLGVDSCMLHAADLFRVPGVGLFGPTSCNEWGFRLSRHRHVCTDGKMDRIQTEDVLTALESLLAVIK